MNRIRTQISVCRSSGLFGNVSQKRDYRVWLLWSTHQHTIFM